MGAWKICKKAPARYMNIDQITGNRLVCSTKSQDKIAERHIRLQITKIETYIAPPAMKFLLIGQGMRNFK